MPYQNITGGISDADRDLVLQKLEEIKALFPHAVNLSAKEKNRLYKMGKKSEKFLYDVQQIVDVSPHFVPQFVSLTDFETDFDQIIITLSIEHKLRTLLEMVVDTRLAQMNECQRPALAIYNNIKEATKHNVPGADAALQLLQPYFAKKRKKK